MAEKHSKLLLFAIATLTEEFNANFSNALAQDPELSQRMQTGLTEQDQNELEAMQAKFTEVMEKSGVDLGTLMEQPNLHVFFQASPDVSYQYILMMDKVTSILIRQMGDDQFMLPHLPAQGKDELAAEQFEKIGAKTLANLVRQTLK